MFFQIFSFFLLFEGIVAQTKPPSCDAQAVCMTKLSENVAVHGDNQTLVCSDLQAFILCVNTVSCLKDVDKENLIALGRQMIRIPCPCLDGQDKCLTTFVTTVFLHLTNKTLACRDVSDYEKCLTGLNCLSQAEKQSLVTINQKIALNGTTCDTAITTTTTTKPMTTSMIQSSTNAASTAYSSRNLALLSVVILSWWFHV
ncbi:uncharacterized protein LOC131934688 [Physella acuta]|uniref:uncharacterized protein LOC131934688 n=1 Tax=Physella acuta TaxID=109671 RepID=UPI0027DD3867|nr:uncharacterized protein LOC131934688 [Physella acuta]